MFACLGLLFWQGWESSLNVDISCLYHSRMFGSPYHCLIGLEPELTTLVFDTLDTSARLEAGIFLLTEGGRGRRLSFAFGALPVDVLDSWDMWISSWPLQQRSCREGMGIFVCGNNGYWPLNVVSQDKEWILSLSMRLALLISVSREWKDGWMTGDGRGAAPSSLEVAIQRALGRYYSGALQRSIGQMLWDLGSWFQH